MNQTNLTTKKPLPHIDGKFYCFLLCSHQLCDCHSFLVPKTKTSSPTSARLAIPEQAADDDASAWWESRDAAQQDSLLRLCLRRSDYREGTKAGHGTHRVKVKI
jgi:hypothetical protein